MIYKNIKTTRTLDSSVKEAIAKLSSPNSNRVLAVGKFNPTTKTLVAIVPAAAWEFGFVEGTILPLTSEMLIVDGTLVPTSTDGSYLIQPNAILQVDKKKFVKDAMHTLSKESPSFRDMCLSTLTFVVQAKVTNLDPVTLTTDDNHNYICKSTIPLTLGEQGTFLMTTDGKDTLRLIKTLPNFSYESFYYYYLIGGSNV